MKKLLVALLFPLIGVAQAKKTNQNGFVITGNIAGLKDSTLVFLSSPTSDNSVVATGYSKKGSFHLIGNVDHADVFLLNFIGYPTVKEVFVTNNKITVTGNANALPQVKIAGGAEQKDYEVYQSMFDPLKEKLNSLAGTINATAPGFTRDSLIGVFEAGKVKVMKQVDEFVKLKPASPVSAFVLFVTSPVTPDLSALENRFNQLTDEAKATHYGQQVERLFSASKVGMEGTMAIDFVQNDTANKPVSLSSFKGKYVLVDFWAAWCGPCRLENPNVVAAYNAYKDKNFTVLGVSLDQSRDKWIQAINADNLTWTHVSDLKFWGNEVAQLYRIQSIPANFLIDPSGKIIARNLRGENLHAVLQQILK